MQKKYYFIILASFLFFTTYISVRGYSASILQPLGGKTGGMDESCTCSDGELLKYTDLNNQTKYLVYMFGVTNAFLNYNEFTEGYWTVLNYFPVGICLIYEGEECEESDNTPNGTLYNEGTGGLPASSGEGGGSAGGSSGGGSFGSGGGGSSGGF